MRVLGCEVGGRRYAVDVCHVRGVVPLGPLTPVPIAPPEIRGVTQLQGQILPVVDLGVALEVRPPPPVLSSRLIDIEFAGMRLLLDAGEPLEVLDVTAGGAEVVDIQRLLDDCRHHVNAIAAEQAAPDGVLTR